MNAPSATTRIGSRSPRDLLLTRGGRIALAVLAAIVAGVLLFVFVQHYRTTPNTSAEPTRVFVASKLIPQGSSANLIASERLLQATTLHKSQVQVGAISDTSVLHGEVAAANIYPGQQITAADFTPATTIASELTGSERALAVPVDSADGLIGFVQTGDYVDVLEARGDSVTTLLRDVLVLSAPGAAGSSGASNIVLRVSNTDATKLAEAGEFGKVWIVMRPPLASTSSNP